MILHLIFLSQAVSAATACNSDGTSNVVTRSLSYDAATGKFSGTMTTNLCPNFPFANYSTGEVAAANALVSPATTITFPGSAYNNPPIAAPLRGSVGYSLYGVNIFGPMDNGFSAGQGNQSSISGLKSTTNKHRTRPEFNSF